MIWTFLRRQWVSDRLFLKGLSLIEKTPSDIHGKNLAPTTQSRDQVPVTGFKVMIAIT